MKLSNLNKLYLGDLGMERFPDSLFELKNLKELHLENYLDDKNPNNFSGEEKERIRKGFPNCEVTFE